MPHPSARAMALAFALALGVAPAFAQSTDTKPVAPGPAVQSDATKAGDPVVAIVNGKEIKRSDVTAMHGSLPQLRQVPLEMVFDQLIDHMINSQLVMAEARKQGLDKDPKVQERLKEVENQVLQQAYLQKTVEAVATDEALKKKYDEMVKDNPGKEEVHARHILVDSEDKAKKAIADIEGGKKFEEVAKENSTGPSGESGGDLGYFTKDDMVPEFAEVAFALKPGEITKTPVKTQFGWHVIKVEDRRMGKPPSFDEVKDQLRSQVAEEAVGKVLDDLRAQAKVQKFAADGSPAGKAEPGGAKEPGKDKAK